MLNLAGWKSPMWIGGMLNLAWWNAEIYGVVGMLKLIDGMLNWN